MNPFETPSVIFRGTRYRCLAHAQWAVYFDTMGVRFQYDLPRRKYEWKAAERYKLGKNSHFDFYAPAFRVLGVGFFDFYQGDEEQRDAMCQRAEWYADQMGDVFYIVHGAPETPYTWKKPKNPVRIVRPRERHKDGRLQHNGRRFYIAAGESHVYSTVALDAAVNGEQYGIAYWARHEPEKQEAPESHPDILD